jgi:hypothetical protein
VTPKGLYCTATTAITTASITTTAPAHTHEDYTRDVHIMAQVPFQLPMGPPPPLINQPPQIFGAFMPEGMSNFTSDMTAQMFGDALHDDLNDPKRRRIAKVGRGRR